MTHDESNSVVIKVLKWERETHYIKEYTQTIRCKLIKAIITIHVEFVISSLTSRIKYRRKERNLATFEYRKKPQFDGRYLKNFDSIYLTKFVIKYCVCHTIVHNGIEIIRHNMST
jgi:hypothetical protein